MLTTRASCHAFGELLVGLHAQRHLAAGADQDHVRLAVGGVGQDVGAAGTPGRGVLRAVERRQAPAASAPDTPARCCSWHDHLPRLDHFVGVAGREDVSGRESPADDARCSIGWCVGPSSPTPIESCVKT